MTYDFYDLLGVPDDASQEEIRRAFRERVRQVHPDLNDDPRAPAQFTALKKGYDVLKDPVERQAYDRLGHTDYVAKRLEGLPDPDRWAPDDAGAIQGDPDSTAHAGTTETSASATVGGGSGSDPDSGPGSASGAGGTTIGGDSGGSTSGSSTGSAGSGGGTGTTSAGRSGTTSGSTGGASVSSSASRDRRGSASTGSAAAGTASTDGAGASAGSGTTVTGGSTRSSVQTSLLDRLRGNVGWPLVFVTAAFYLAGLGGYLLANRAGIRTLVDRLSAVSSTDAAWLALTATDYAVASPSAFVDAGLFGDGSLPRAALLVAACVVLPTVFLVVVRTTRQTRSFAWKPTYLYVVATLAPLAALVAGAAGVAVATRPAVSLLAVGVLPVLAIVVLPLNAFVVPWLRRQLG